MSSKHALVIEKLIRDDLDYRKIVYIVARYNPLAILNAIEISEGRQPKDAERVAPFRESVKATAMRTRVLALLKDGLRGEAVDDVRKTRHCSAVEADNLVKKIEAAWRSEPELSRKSYAERAEDARRTADRIISERKPAA